MYILNYIYDKNVCEMHTVHSKFKDRTRFYSIVQNSDLYICKLILMYFKGMDFRYKYP